MGRSSNPPRSHLQGSLGLLYGPLQCGAAHALRGMPVTRDDRQSKGGLSMGLIGLLVVIVVVILLLRLI